MAASTAKKNGLFIQTSSFERHNSNFNLNTKVLKYKKPSVKNGGLFKLIA
ncbi:MAG: hypothetical protein HYS21_01505 [Deltaproteobacteria bacterium]|nr:hypothetical protein [Deltaproteobacteria bacterium]